MKQDKNINIIKKNIYSRVPLLVLIVEIIIFSIATSNFYSFGNIKNIFLNSSIDGLIAIGLTFVIISGGLDLSIGANKALSAAIAIITFKSTANIFLAVIAGILTGTIVGLVNGIFVSKGKVTPFIATLGTFLIVNGLVLLVTHNGSVTIKNLGYSDIAGGRLFYINFPIWLFVIFIILGYLFLTKTKIGKYIFGIGGSEAVCKLMGIDVDKYKIIIYMVGGTLCGMAGVILSARASGASPQFGQETMFIVIGAVILGGTSFRGGEGGVIQSLIGLLIYVSLQNAFGILNIEPFYQYYAWGLLLVVATVFDNWRHSKAIMVQ